MTAAPSSGVRRAAAQEGARAPAPKANGESNEAPSLITAQGLERALGRAARALPAQAPLEVFVHHNTLHAFQSLPFHEAVAAAHEAYGAAGYLPEARYRAAFREGRIAEADVDDALARRAPNDLPAPPRGLPGALSLAKLALLHDVGPETPAGLAWRLTEHQAATRFADAIAPEARRRAAHETTAWLRGELERTSVGRVVALLVGDGGDERRRDFAFEETFGRRATREGLARVFDGDAERAAVACLWQACRARQRAPSRAGGVDRRRAHPRDAIVAAGHDDPYDLVHPVLISLAGAFLDRGQSHWPMPDREHGFFTAFCRVLGAGRAVRPSWLTGLGARLRSWGARRAAPAVAARELLREVGVEAFELDAFVERTLLALPGWAGMFHRLESAPGPIGRSHALVRLEDFFAVRLCLDALAFAELGRRLGHRGPLAALRGHIARLPPASSPEGAGDHDGAWPLFLLAQHAGLTAPDVLRAGDDAIEALSGLLRRFDRGARQVVWHEAYEQNYREGVLRALAARGREPLPEAPARFQLIACIDDRLESLRRHFEELSPGHATFGTPGFFNLAIAYQGIDDPSTFPLCPVVVTPQHLVEEEPVSGQAHLAAARRRWRRRFGSASAGFGKASRSLVWGPALTAFAGFLAALPLLAEVFAPWAAGRLREKVASWLLPSPKTRLAGPHPGAFSEAEAAFAAGFSLDEKAARVGDLLENVGLVRDFARVVAVVGHDSSGSNNPHVAAYSCGACGGRSGGPNARLFARMANRPQVRRLLRGRGIDIPDETVFVGGVHDTCADRVTLFDADGLPAFAQPELGALREALDEACRRNAHERCRRFASAPRAPSPEAALRHVEGRSYDPSQARPELGHATNAACVVGRRSLTRGVFLDRRAFLASYDPRLDPKGAILERILLAVGPVGAGINLEYFFSTTDGERYGAGTKLPHNVTGLVGVMNGASSDLRTGLPKQMIEVHEPLRLQLVVEASPQTLLAVTRRQPGLRELAVNEWLRLIAIDPETRGVWLFDGVAGFVPWAPGRRPRLPTVARSADWYAGKNDFVPPALVTPGAGAGAGRGVG